jgi:hypothetical protein
VDADKKSRTSEIVFEGLTFNGMAAVREVLAALDASSLGEEATKI